MGQLDHGYTGVQDTDRSSKPQIEKVDGVRIEEIKDLEAQVYQDALVEEAKKELEEEKHTEVKSSYFAKMK